jgi:hypothetical protein
MKLKLRRSQKSGLTGNVTFQLFFIVDLNDEEAEALRKYKFGRLIVYETPKGAAASEGFKVAAASGGIGDMGRSFASAMAAKAFNQILSVDDMANGKEVTCKDITEMMAAEEQIKDACQSLARILHVCQHFDGEEIINIEPFQAEA